MKKVEQIHQRSLELLRDHDRETVVEYFKTLDPQIVQAVYDRIMEQRDQTKRDLQQALDDLGIINDPETKKWRRLGVSIRRRFRQRRYRRRMRLM